MKIEIVLISTLKHIELKIIEKKESKGKSLTDRFA